MPDSTELYTAPPWAPHQDLKWLETLLNAQSLQFMIDCLPSIHEEIARHWKGVPLKVLDVGTASGAGANLLGNLYAGLMLGYQITVDALELMPSLEAYAKANYPFINYIQANVLDLRGRPIGTLFCAATQWNMWSGQPISCVTSSASPGRWF